MQAHDAEQAAAGVSRLRGRKPCPTSEDVRSQVGIRFHASRGASQVSIHAGLLLNRSVSFKLATQSAFFQQSFLTLCPFYVSLIRCDTLGFTPTSSHKLKPSHLAHCHVYMHSLFFLFFRSLHASVILQNEPENIAQS